MRNRITFKGFAKWVMRQKNDRVIPCRDENKCAIAQYVLNVFKADTAEVCCSENISYTLNGKKYIVSAPDIMSAYIEEFDDGKGNGAGAKLALKNIKAKYKLVGSF